MTLTLSLQVFSASLHREQQYVSHPLPPTSSRTGCSKMLSLKPLAALSDAIKAHEVQVVRVKGLTDKQVVVVVELSRTLFLRKLS